jgi:hypothetical protein
MQHDSLDATAHGWPLDTSPAVLRLGRRRLAAYDAERRPLTSQIVLSNRKGGPEGIIDIVESRAPEGFHDIEAVASYAERQAIVQGYARMAGYAPSPSEVNA